MKSCSLRLSSWCKCHFFSITICPVLALSPSVHIEWAESLSESQSPQLCLYLLYDLEQKKKKQKPKKDVFINLRESETARGWGEAERENPEADSLSAQSRTTLRS